MKKIFLAPTLFILLSFAIYPLYKISHTKNRQKPDVAICGSIALTDGKNKQTIDLAQTLAEKYNVQKMFRYANQVDLSEKIKKRLKSEHKQSPSIVIMKENLWTPGDPPDQFFYEVDSKKQVRYAYSTLNPRDILSEWVIMMNLYFDAIIVPDLFLVDAYVKAGITVPIFHIPPGIDVGDFLRTPLKQPKTKGPLIFASLGDGNTQENHKMVIQTFAKALGNIENAKLYVNCQSPLPWVRDEIINEVIKQNCNNIRYTEVCLKKDAYLKFLNSVDCLLNFSIGKKFSPQSQEAIALGIPIILTENTEHPMIRNNEFVNAVPSFISVPSHHDRYIYRRELFLSHLEDHAAGMRNMHWNYTKHASKRPMIRKWASNYHYKNLVKSKDLPVKFLKSLDNTEQIMICNNELVNRPLSSTQKTSFCYGKKPKQKEQLNCDLDVCASIIRGMNWNYTLYAKKGLLMRKWAEDRSYRNALERYESLIFPKKVMLGDVNEVTKDCITTNSRALYDKYITIRGLNL